MKKVIIYILIGLAVLFLLWKFLIKTSKKTLADGSVIYKKGGNFYLNTDGSEIKIDENEYKRLFVFVEGDCTNPNSVQIQDVQTCNYHGYKGKVNDCGDCAIVHPVQISHPCNQYGPCYTSDGNSCWKILNCNENALKINTGT